MATKALNYTEVEYTSLAESLKAKGSGMETVKVYQKVPRSYTDSPNLLQFHNYSYLVAGALE